MSKKIARIDDVDDLIALREDYGYLDVLGVGKASQSKIANVLTVAVVVAIFATYYVVYAVLLYEYQLQASRAL